MGTPTRIVALAEQIQTYAHYIDAYLHENNLPPLSFDVSAAADLPEATFAAQKGLLESADELSLLVEGPQKSLMRFGGYDVLLPILLYLYPCLLGLHSTTPPFLFKQLFTSTSPLLSPQMLPRPLLALPKHATSQLRTSRAYFDML